VLELWYCTLIKCFRKEKEHNTYLNSVKQ